jgi:acetylornithine/succinyldiaminopimelate/putrescine aminotransferase
MFLLPNRPPLFAVRGAAGCHLDTDLYGEVFDFVSGWNVANLGWQRKEVMDAVVNQVRKQAFSPSWLPHCLRDLLAAELGSVAGMGYDFFAASTGSEAVETCLKIARLVTKRQRIIAFRNAYHGNTLGCIQVGSSKDLFDRHGVEGCSPPSLLDLPEVFDRRAEKNIQDAFRSGTPPCAVIFEPIFTNPGVLPAPQEMLALIQHEACEAGALIICDEVGTGFCRTGRWFGFQHYGLSPHLIALGKAMGGGIQSLAGVGVHSGISRNLKGSEFINTFGWMPVACAAGVEVIKVLKEINGAGEAARKGMELKELLQAGFRKFPDVRMVRGLGLEIGVLLNFDFGKIKKLQLNLLEKGVYVELTHVNRGLILMPPIVSDDTTLASAAEAIIEETISI